MGSVTSWQRGNDYMKNSGLAKKITGVLMATSVLAVLAAAVLMLLMTRQAFSNYIDQNNQAIFAQVQPVINEYIAQYGTDDLQQYLSTNGTAKGIVMGRGRGLHKGVMSEMGMKRQGQRLLVTDPNGIVLADSYGLLLGKKADFDTSHAVSGAVTLNDKQSGTLYLTSPLSSGLASLENEFVSKITVRTAILAVIIALVALLLGLVLGKRITAPLAALSAGIHNLAQGKLDERIKLQGDREFMELGEDFNLMAQKLEDADKNRRRLTADLSHELRTPLTFLRGQLEGMQNASVPMDAENMTLLLDEVIRLTRLVKELENLAQVENQAVVLHEADFSLEELLERLIPVSLAMQEKGMEFIIDAAPEVKNIHADPDRLLQILLNLLSNAMHHAGSEGRVCLSISRSAENLLFSVTDNGPGIPVGDLPYVFERFYRTDESRNRHEGGMGLGLAIARGYVEAHHGKIWAENHRGGGAAFRFTLPQ